jgi:signal transduction histidine kinase
MHLLRKTITAYFIYSAILLIVAIPIFYLVLKKIMVNNVDENLVTTKTIIVPKLQYELANHLENKLVLSGYDIQYEKTQPEKFEDSMYTFESTATDHDPLSSNRLLVSHFYVNEEFYNLHITTSLTDKFSLAKRIIWVISVLLVALLLGLLIMNHMMTKKIWKPFYNTLNRLKAYRVDKQAILKLEKSPVIEFNDLNQAICVLTETSYRTYQTQKEFTENASHEMQSPLSVFQSKLELLMQTSPLNEEQASLIADMADASKRMLKLNKTLILLTKIDNDQFLEKENLSVKGILENLIKQYEFQISNQVMSLEFVDEGDVQIEANKTLIEILLGNLLSNSIRHNLSNGFVQIFLNEKELTIQNSGKPSALDRKKLFRRFQKESHDTESIGLGLEIVNKICALYHYQIQYQFINQMHVFNLTFLPGM